MLTEFQKRKFTRMFNALDINGDGGINAKDIELVIARHGEEGAGRATPANMETLAGAYRTWYSGIISLADHDRDGNVTLDEFLAFSDKMTSDEAIYEQIIGKITQMACAILDHDGDGRNDTDDYVRFCRVLRIGDEGAAARWAALSAHRGGQMSVDDMRVVLRDFFSGTDTSAPATNFLGVP
jgi:hypothetical protein